MTPAPFTFCECKVCEFTAVVRTVDRPEIGFACPLCLEDSGKVNIMSERPATDDDRPERDVRREAMKGLRADIAKNIHEYGQHVQGVGAGENSPQFCYTIGNAIIGLPELLIIGPYPFPAMTMMLNVVGQHMRAAGKPPEPGLLDLDWTYPFKIRECGPKAKEDFTTIARHYLGRDDFKVLQVMICDPEGRYPGDEGCHKAFDVVQP